jgi:hypothetical protein
MTTRNAGSVTVRHDLDDFVERAKRAARDVGARLLEDATSSTVDYARVRWPVGDPEGGHSRDQFFSEVEDGVDLVVGRVGNHASYAADIVSDGERPWDRYVVGPSVFSAPGLASALAERTAAEIRR